MSAVAVSAADLPSDRFALAPRSSREAEVNRLVAEGLRDREIGEALFINHRTVMRHMTNILAKFEVPPRGAAAWYLRHARFPVRQSLCSRSSVGQLNPRSTATRTASARLVTPSLR